MENGKIIRCMFVNNSIKFKAKRQYILNNIKLQRHRAQMPNKQMLKRKRRRKFEES